MWVRILTRNSFSNEEKKSKSQWKRVFSSPWIVLFGERFSSTTDTKVYYELCTTMTQWVSYVSELRTKNFFCLSLSLLCFHLLRLSSLCFNYFLLHEHFLVKWNGLKDLQHFTFLEIVMSVQWTFYSDLTCVNKMNWNEMCFSVALLFRTNLLDCFAYVFRFFRFLCFLHFLVFNVPYRISRLLITWHCEPPFCQSSTWLWTVNWIQCKMLWADGTSHKKTKFSGWQSIKAVRQKCFLLLFHSEEKYLT